MTENNCDSLAHELTEKLLEKKKNRDLIVKTVCVIGVILAIAVFILIVRSTPIVENYFSAKIEKV